MIPIEACEAALMNAMNTYTGDTYTRTDELNRLALEYWQKKNKNGVPTVELGSWESDYIYNEFWYYEVILEIPASPTESSSWQTIAQNIHEHTDRLNGVRKVGFAFQEGLKNGQRTIYLAVTIYCAMYL